MTDAVAAGTEKAFPTLAAATLATGTFLGGSFSDVHEAAEWLIGHPVWTHELPSIGDRLSELVREQAVGMPDTAKPDWETTRDSIIAAHGETVMLRRGEGIRTRNPLDTVMSAVAGEDAQPWKTAIYYSTAKQLEDAEHWFGPYASREIAIEICRARFPNVGCWTAEGSAQTHRLDVIDRGLFQPDGAVGEAFDTVNAELIGDGGERSSWDWTAEAVDVLVGRLNVHFAAWAQEHGYQRSWTLDLSAEEWTPASEAEPAMTSERPRLSLVGMGGRG